MVKDVLNPVLTKSLFYRWNGLPVSFSFRSITSFYRIYYIVFVLFYSFIILILSNFSNEQSTCILCCLLCSYTKPSLPWYLLIDLKGITPTDTWKLSTLKTLVKRVTGANIECHGSTNPGRCDIIITSRSNSAQMALPEVTFKCIVTYTFDVLVT